MDNWLFTRTHAERERQREKEREREREREILLPMLQEFLDNDISMSGLYGSMYECVGAVWEVVLHGESGGMRGQCFQGSQEAEEGSGQSQALRPFKISIQYKHCREHYRLL